METDLGDFVQTKCIRSCLDVVPTILITEGEHFATLLFGGTFRLTKNHYSLAIIRNYIPASFGHRGFTFSKYFA